ncbi:MAG: sodium:proton antiporter [Lachnospiraceae bacterium]|nr:sodium:proton antiporter [Lachnospiraceae bacterium]
MSGNVVLFHTVWFPFVAAFVSYLTGRRSKAARDRVVQLAVAAEFGLMLAAAATYFRGGEQEFLLAGFCGQGIYLKMDGFCMLYGTIATFMWLGTGVFSREYFGHYRNRNRYHFFYLLTLGATMGVFLSGDLYTTFVFFEVMSLASYVWVVHDETEKAMKAGEIYLAIAVIGGLVMLMGLLLLYDAAGTLRMSELHGAVAAVWLEKRMQIYAAGGCLLFGFGAKAGMFPLHVWLPKAHPVAPAPASALLSGILTKTGVFGILIVCAEVFRYDETWGLLILGFGVVTMFGGALLAVFSVDLKRTLACSSMSQIGFILVGTGMMELLGEGNALAVRGTILHMVNHSTIKLILFMAAGVVYMNLHKLNLNEVRGFGRKKPLLAGIFLTGALSIGGVLGFSGYVSKTLLHESIVEYAEELAELGRSALWVRGVEWVFLLTGGMTVAYMTKLFVAVFLEKNPERQAEYDAKKRYMNRESALALLVPAALLLILGFFPYLTMNRIADLAQGFLHGVSPEHAVHYFSWTNLQGALISLTIGAIVYFGIIRRFLMGRNESGETCYKDLWPAWLDLEERVYRPVFQKGAVSVCGFVCGLVDRLTLTKTLLRCATNLGSIACGILDRLYLVKAFLRGLMGFTALLSRACDYLVDYVLVFFRRTTHRSTTERHVYLIGSRFSRVAGTLLDRVAAVLNCTILRRRPIRSSFVVRFAEWEEVMHKTNRMISVSLSFGLMLAIIGLGLTLVYLLWW